MYTLIAMVAIAVYITISFYNAQIKIFQEKELFKLECIANAVSFRIDAADHTYLAESYTSEDLDSILHDPAYDRIRMQLMMALAMNDSITTDMYTLMLDSSMNPTIAVRPDQSVRWGEGLTDYPAELLNKYETGGWSDEPYERENGTWLSAVAPITNGDGTLAGILQVDEKFDSFIARAQDQILFNIILTLVIIIFISVLMFLSVKSILNRQERLAAERDEIEQMRNELIANVSHDLRTPLASIHGYIETILMKKDSLDKERLVKYLNTTLKSTERLKNLVDELFELSKLESLQGNLNLETFPVDDLLHDVAHNYKIEAGKNQINLNTHVAKELKHVSADIALIDRVLQNLITNSIKFCEPGDSIDVSAACQGGRVEITVKDNGQGIAQNELPHVFERFHKGNSQKPGSGLGLAIVKRILDLHQSEYEITSEPGSGTSFRFTLKYAEAAKQAS